MNHISPLSNKRVLVTGHTGFKGSWLCLWLRQLGAKVFGIALDPPTSPSMFDIANIATCLAEDIRMDIRAADLANVIQAIQPEVIFHLAAQPLVQYSYDFPAETYAVNMMGTVNLLEAIKNEPSVKAVVIVTSDKCYENNEQSTPYTENDRLGGKDPYSSSKACVEMIVEAYRNSFFQARNVYLATARAGNVIGGGDWAPQRLIPDLIRAYAAHEPIRLRYPEAIRPWQHVLESIKGYILLSEKLLSVQGAEFAEAWNFGPALSDMKRVKDIAQHISQVLNLKIELDASLARHEASLLKLDSSKAMQRLGWDPCWSLHESIDKTLAWYQSWFNKTDMLNFSYEQIQDYMSKKIKLSSVG